MVVVDYSRNYRLDEVNYRPNSPNESRQVPPLPVHHLPLPSSAKQHPKPSRPGHCHIGRRRTIGD